MEGGGEAVNRFVELRAELEVFEEREVVDILVELVAKGKVGESIWKIFDGLIEGKLKGKSLQTGR